MSEDRIGEHVWAKVKGFPFWPGLIVSGDAIAGKKKGHYCVKFFGESNYSWVSRDNLKNYEEDREKLLKVSKKASIKKAIAECEQHLEETLGRKLPPAVFGDGTPNRASTKSAGDVSLDKSLAASGSETPKSELFKRKAPAVQSAPLQKDYSRTPFKKEKRSFDSAFDAIINEPLPAVKLENEEKKVFIPTGGDRAKRSSVKLAPATTTTASTSSLAANKRASTSATAYNFVKVAEPDSDNEDVSTSNISKMEQITIKKRGRVQAQSNIRYGFIGVGKIGSHLLRSMISYNHQNTITIWNAEYGSLQEFENLGCIRALTPADVVRGSDIIFSCLEDADAASNIFFGNCGVRNEINACKGYVELTPLDPSVSTQIDMAIKSRLGRYLEAPILGHSLRHLESGTLTALMAGDRSLFDDCFSFFEANCAHVYFLSEFVGNATKMNIAISSLFGITVAALNEFASFIDRLGLVQGDFVEILKNSTFSPLSVIDKAETLMSSSLLRELPIDNIRRDLHYALDLSDQINFPTPIAATTNEVLKQKKQAFY